MANPYKKAEQKPKVAPGSRPGTPVVQQPVEPKVEEKKQEVIVPEVQQPVEPKIVEKKQEVVAPVKEETPVEPVKEVEIIETKASDLFAGLIDEKPRGKTVGFYLDEDVIAALEKVAKQKKKNKSNPSV